MSQKYATHRRSWELGKAWMDSMPKCALVSQRAIATYKGNARIWGFIDRRTSSSICPRHGGSEREDPRSEGAYFVNSKLDDIS